MNEMQDNTLPQDQQASPMDLALRLHRLLRGRYALVITLALVGGLGAAAAGWFLPVPKYTSIGVVEIIPKREAIMGESDLTQVTPFFREYVNTEAAKITQDRMLDRAMNSEAWRGVREGTGPAAQRAFREALQVRVQGASGRLINVSFTHKDPVVAQVGAASVISAYMEIRAEEDAADRRKVDAVRRLQSDLNNRITGLEAQIRAVRAPFPGTELQSQRDMRGDLLFELQSKLAMINAQVAQAEAGEAMDPALAYQSDERLASIDPEMRRMMNELSAERSNLSSARSTYGESHHVVGRLKRRIESLEQSVALKRDELLKSPLLLTLPRDTQLGFGSPDALIEARDEIAAQIRDQEDALLALNNAIEEEARLHRSLSVARQQLASADSRYQLFEVQGLTEGGGDEGLVRDYPASRPMSPSVDDRKKYAVLGGLAGGGFPIGLVLMLGLLDRRFRYSDEAIVGPATPLLGILPKLPRQIRDAEQASVAAHCVHQIRTLLQIGSPDRNTLVITSPTAGDGKTALALSLGLSYASAGKRTLLIDLDLLGCGLSHLMELDPAEGTLAAIEAGGLKGFVATTWLDNLSVLPAAKDDVHGISRLTPERIRHLLEAARRQFDMVIIDTGPVLGSLEASLVVKEADAVVLAVRRGQRREMAQRAIEYIRSLDGVLIGMIFNQAQSGDFRRAVSSASLRSRPIERTIYLNGNAERVDRLGPMPGALVATSQKESA